MQSITSVSLPGEEEERRHTKLTPWFLKEKKILRKTVVGDHLMTKMTVTVQPLPLKWMHQRHGLRPLFSQLLSSSQL